MAIKRVTVAGGGVLGSQIALQSAVHGFDVTIYDISSDALVAAKDKIENFVPRYISDLNFTADHITQAASSIDYTDDIKKGLADADLLIESIVERLDIKLDFYGQVAEVAPEKTIFATNTSTLLPSTFMDATGRPEQFLALHFANEIWIKNIAEVMKTDKTSDDVFQEILQFAKDIGMVALPLEKEQPGYILNTMLTRFLTAAQYLFGNQIADYETIDRVWLTGTSQPIGPFGVLDPIGLETTANIMRNQIEHDPVQWKVDLLKYMEERIEDGKLGKFSGEGYYKYPNPAFLADNFLDIPDEYETYAHNIHKILIAGAGVFGRQLAYHIAQSGFSVTLYDVNEKVLEDAERVIAENDEGKSLAITYTSDRQAGARDADLIIEAIPEIQAEKESFFKDLSSDLEGKTILITVTSTLLPSQLAPTTGCPERFMAVNFSTPIWENNSAEIMPTEQTDEEIVKQVIAFTRDIHCRPFVIEKEQSGYILTTLIIPVLYAALLLVADEISSVEAVDKTWMITRMTNIGPFGTIDRIGLHTVVNIVENLYHDSDNLIDHKILQLLKEKLEKGETGIHAGHGFYDYAEGVPYLADSFLK